MSTAPGDPVIISTPGRADLAVRTWPCAEPRVGVLVVHGLGEHAGRYDTTARQMVDAGIHVEAFDLSGFGLSGGHRAFVANLDVWLDEVAARLGALSVPAGTPKVVLGHSMGGLVSLAHAVSGRTPPDRLVVSAPALDADVAAWKRRLAPVMGRIAPRLPIPNDITGDQLSRDPAVAAAYFADPLVQTRTTARLGAVIFSAQQWVTERLGDLVTPTLVLHGSDDTLVPPIASAALAHLDCVTREVIEGARHEPFNEPDSATHVARVVRFATTGD